MNMESLCEFVLDEVTKSGATGDLIVDQGESLSLKARENQLEEHKISSSRIFGLRIIKDQRVGTSYSESADQESLKAMVDQALVNSKFASPREHEKILDNKLELNTDDALLCPPDTTSVEDKISLVLGLEDALRKKEKVKNVPYNGLQEGVGERFVFSSSGLKAHSRVRSYSLYAYALMEDGENKVMEGVGQVARNFNGLSANDVVDQTHANCLALLEVTQNKG